MSVARRALMVGAVGEEIGLGFGVVWFVGLGRF